MAVPRWATRCDPTLATPWWWILFSTNPVLSPTVTDLLDPASDGSIDPDLLIGIDFAPIGCGGPQEQDDDDDGSSIPATGQDPWPLVLLGLTVLLAGVIVVVWQRIWMRPLTK